MELMFWQEHMWNEAASRQLEAELSTDDYVAVPASKGGVHVKHAAFRVSSPRSPIVRKATGQQKGQKKGGREGRSMTPRTRAQVKKAFEAMAAEEGRQGSPVLRLSPSPKPSPPAEKREKAKTNGGGKTKKDPLTPRSMAYSFMSPWNSGMYF